ncbi:glutamine--fructose-6-phosphate transaminase (isomerizing) [Rhodococcus sp. WS4]|nr:glutamine--fructose-6-phosphate transaminase (isomerizing) [Rhodococcus sp. WS4]
MCAIVACRTTAPVVCYLLAALRRLEYRGYDSAGISVMTSPGEMIRVRNVGRIDDLAREVRDWPDQAGLGIGHTRWATHGGITESDAHPHTDCSGRVSLVHNGIIDNAEELRLELTRRGHVFSSLVDSEVICHLVEEELASTGDLLAAVQSAVARLEGSWAMAVADSTNGRLVVAANKSPLLVARSVLGDFAASDPAAFADWVDSYSVLVDGSVVELGAEFVWTDGDRVVAPPAPHGCAWRGADADLGGYGDHMGREIAEQPEAAARILDELDGGIADGSLWRNLGLGDFRQVEILACGTSLHAGLVLAGELNRFAHIRTVVSIASEVDVPEPEPGTLYLAISQSGETADVLRAIDRIGPRAESLLALTNNTHSTLARTAGAVVPCSAGPEFGVAATKTFVCQILAGSATVLSAMAATGRIDLLRAKELVEDLYRVPERLATALRISEQLLPELVLGLIDEPGFLFIARGSGLPYAAEGALKLKEITYRWAEYYPAGELKHGPLALVRPGTPVIVVDNGDPRLAGNISEVRTRGAYVTIVGRRGRTLPVLPDGPDEFYGPLESVIPMQLLARDLAIALGRDVDKPRNLAKSVTVE